METIENLKKKQKIDWIYRNEQSFENILYTIAFICALVMAGKIIIYYSL